MQEFLVAYAIIGTMLYAATLWCWRQTNNKVKEFEKSRDYWYDKFQGYEAKYKFYYTRLQSFAHHLHAIADKMLEENSNGAGRPD